MARLTGHGRVRRLMVEQLMSGAPSGRGGRVVGASVGAGNVDGVGAIGGSGNPECGTEGPVAGGRMPMEPRTEPARKGTPKGVAVGPSIEGDVDDPGAGGGVGGPQEKRAVCERGVTRSCPRGVG